MFVITEKPSVAKDIAAGLGGFTKISYGEKDFYFERNGDIIVSSAGHLLTLFMPADYDENLKNWRLEDLPIIPGQYKYKPIESTYSVLQKIKYCFENYSSKDLVLATDAEREGEHIGALILDYLGFKDYSTAKRFWVSEALTPEVVKKGFQNLKPLSDFVSYKKAGFARARSDWLLGINISRLLAISTSGKTFFGRVQTAILGAIFLREKNIENFKPVHYYQLQIQVQKDSDSFAMLYNENNTSRFKTKDEVQNIVNMLNQRNVALIVKNIETENKTLNPPQLFNITELQKYCANNFHLTPEKTLEIAQELYEKYKCLSYPRTPSKVLGDDNVDLFREKYELLAPAYPLLAQGCANEKIVSENKNIFNSKKLQDHHALIPLDKLPDNVSNDVRNVYESVLLRFFQTIKEPHIYGITTVTASAEKAEFVAKGKSIIQQGWKEQVHEQENDDENNQILPISNLKVNDQLKISKTEILQKETQPKKHYTNASILALMENPKGEDENLGKLVGIGTPATRANIIATLIKHEYIWQKGQNLLITELGKFIIQTITKVPCLAKLITIDTTTEWEKQLETQPEEFLKTNEDFLKTEIPKIRITEKWEKENFGDCPLCHSGKILEGQKSFYCSDYKSGCKCIIWKDNFCHTKITSQDVRLLLSGKKTKVKKFTSPKTGKVFQAALMATIENRQLKISPVFN